MFAECFPFSGCLWTCLFLWDIVFVFFTMTWCKVFRLRVDKRGHLCNCLWWLQKYRRFRLFTSLFSCCLKMVLQYQGLSGKGRVVFLISFPSGNCFCDVDLFISRSLRLRIEFPLSSFHYPSGAGDFNPIWSEGESLILRRPFLLHNSLEKLQRLIIEICYGIP